MCQCNHIIIQLRIDRLHIHAPNATKHVLKNIAQHVKNGTFGKSSKYVIINSSNFAYYIISSLLKCKELFWSMEMFKYV